MRDTRSAWVLAGPEPGVVRLGGVLDAAGVLLVQGRLLRAVTAHSPHARCLLVLDDVEVLAAPGIRLIEGALGAATMHGIELDVRASPGTPAHLVLGGIDLEEQSISGAGSDGSSARTRVALIDGSVDTRELMRFYLDRQPDFQVVSESADAITGLRAVVHHRPTLALLDTLVPDGLQAVRRIRELSPATLVVLSSSFVLTGDEAVVERGSGPHGHVRTDAGLKLMLAELRTILHTHDLA